MRHVQDYKKALELIGSPDTAMEGVVMLRNAAEYGNPRAMCEYGRLYNTPGAPVTQNPDEAFQWFLKSAEYGDDRGQFYTGLAYYEGTIVDQDLALALKWFTLSAEKGYALAQNYLGHMYFEGNGVPQDEKEAERWFLLSVGGDCDEARISLGDIYFDPKYKDHDLKFAFTLYKEAMDNNYPLAFYKVGLMHYQGKGMPINMITASQCFRSGTELNNMECYYMLGLMYYYGKGVQKDVQKATRYLTFAEQGGIKEATEFLNKALDRKKRDWNTGSTTIRVIKYNTPDLLYVVDEHKKERKDEEQTPISRGAPSGTEKKGLFGFLRRR